MVFNNNLLLGASGAGGYTIDQSIRFNDNDSGYLYRTPSSASNRRTWTLSYWIKRANLGGFMNTFDARLDGDNYAKFQFHSGDYLQFLAETGGGGAYNLATTRLFRDPGAWYHIVLAVDTTQSTAADRVKIYVNGTQETSFISASYPAQNYDTFVNTTNGHALASNFGGAAFLDGYMAEINFVDGQQLDPSSFGEVNADTGQWIAKKYSGSSGTNGFHITGEDSADLGADYSGNGNDFTSSGLTSADQMSDSPTNNWCVLNSINLGTSETLANGNLDVANSASAWRSFSGTHGVSSGKWYWEATQTGTVGGSNAALIGIAEYQEADFARLAVVTKIGPAAGGYAFENWTGDKRDPAETSSSYGSAVTSGQIVGVALDLDNAKIWFSINNTWQASGDPAAGTNEAFASLPAVEWCPAGSLYNATNTYNFGQSAFAYTPPTGFKALNTANLLDPTIVDPSAYFQPTLYAGNGTAIGSGGLEVNQSENSTFQPDFVWIKNRSAADNHMLYDSVRGATKDLHSNAAAAEVTDTEGLSTFDTDGFTVGSNVEVNTNAENYVAWQWYAPTTSTNTDGSVSSTLSVDQTSGLSIGTFDGTGANLTAGHGLGVAPDFIIATVRPNAANWNVYHSAIGNTGALRLNLRNPTSTSAQYWNNTSPTSTVITFGTNGSSNSSGNSTIFYAFTEVEGYSAFGSYVGNGNASGPMINLGFEPAFLMFKSTGDNKWVMKDTERSPFNDSSLSLVANNSDAELTNDQPIDINSNGFKLRTTGSGVNSNGVTYVYIAFASSPFKTANAR